MTDETPDLRTEAEQLYEGLPEEAQEVVNVEGITEDFETFVDEYRVPRDEARDRIRENALEAAGLDDDAEQNSNDVLLVGEVDAPEEWIDLEAIKVDQLWDSDADAVAQTGLIGDESGKIMFTAWAKSNLEPLEEGEVYDLRNVVTDEYQGDFNVKLNSTTEIEHHPDAEVTINEGETVEGALVDVQSPSGLVKRCASDDCTRVLQNDRCSEHGDVEGEFDLRIKAILDDGTKVHRVLFNREATVELTGIDLEEAQQMAQDALDTSVVEEEMADQVVGHHYRVEGPSYHGQILANEAKRIDSQYDGDDVLIKARSM